MTYTCIRTYIYIYTYERYLKPDIILGSAAIYKYRLYEELAVLEERRQRNEPMFNTSILRR